MKGVPMHDRFYLWFGKKLSEVVFEINFACCEIGIKREMRALKPEGAQLKVCELVEREIRNRLRSRSAGPLFTSSVHYEVEISKLNK